MNNFDYRLYVEVIPRKLPVQKDISPFEYDTVEPTESIYDSYNISYINETPHPVCSPIPIRVPSREPVPYRNTSDQLIIIPRIYYTKDSIIYSIIISAGIVCVCIVFVYFYKWFDKNRIKIGKIQSLKNIPKSPKYTGWGEKTPEHTNYNSYF